jgi:hypothetical protein
MDFSDEGAVVHATVLPTPAGPKIRIFNPWSIYAWLMGLMFIISLPRFVMYECSLYPGITRIVNAYFLYFKISCYSV